MSKIDIETNKYFANTSDVKYTLPFLKIQYHVPGGKAYKFYASGDFIKKYAMNAKTHKPRENEVLLENGTYKSMGEYMAQHQTKEQTAVKIPVFSSDNAGNGKVAASSIVFDSVLSLCDEHTEKIGLMKDKERITEYYFNQFIKSHKFNKEDWAYFGALHTNTDNDHLHVVFYQPEAVKKENLVDFNDFKNLLTKKETINRVKRYAFLTIENKLNAPWIKEIYQQAHLLQANFKQQIKTGKNREQLIKLAVQIKHYKGDEGRLQYGNLDKWAKIKGNNPEKVLLNKVNGTVDALVYKNKEFAENFANIKNNMKEALNLNLKLKHMDVATFKLDLEQYQRFEKEIHTNLANTILKACKEINIEDLANRHTAKVRRKQNRKKNARFVGASECREYVNHQEKYSNNQWWKVNSAINKVIQYNMILAQEQREHLEKLQSEWEEQQRENSKFEMGM